MGGAAIGKTKALILLALFGVACGVAAWSLRDFRIEASSDALVLEDDPAMRVYDASRVTYGNDEFVFVTVTREDLFSRDGVAYVEGLVRRLSEVRGIVSVSSIVDLPLFLSGPEKPNLIKLRFQGLAGQPRLTDQRIDLARARRELTSSPVFAGNLVSRDGRTANLVATFYLDPELKRVMDETLGLKAKLSAPLEAERAALSARLAVVEPRYLELEAARKDARIATVHEIRALIVAERRAGNDVNASGLPLIVVDMVDFIGQDLKVFGLASVVFLALFLGLVFRRVRWVMLPLTTCLGTAVLVLGLFVFEGKTATVITCNIPSLLIVIGLAHGIHIIVRYRELLASESEEPDAQRLDRTLRSIFEPCLYSALTTGVGFVSLVVSGIRPVVDFGTHMALGVALAFALSFTVFPAALAWLKALPASDGRGGGTSGLLGALARGSLKLRRWVVVVSLLALTFSIAGLARLRVESRFSDYFLEDSSIYKGLRFIDDEMEGTTQIELLLRSSEPGVFRTPVGLARVRAAEGLLESESAVGKVVGLASITELCAGIASASGAQINEAVLISVFVPALGREQLAPYVNEDWSEARVVARVRENSEGLDRSELIARVRAGLEERGAGPAEVTGMFVLYTNMLESLTGSQWKTALAVSGALFFMMFLLFRSVSVALLCMVPNALPILFVLGLMGWCGIQLDMATVMIASVSLGIAVDGTIHYTFRFREEMQSGAGDPARAVESSHRSIGQGIFLTTMTSIVGFWVLMLSNFKPNIYFGMFTGVAMLIALFGTLTVLPVGLYWLRPFRPQEQS